jgi:transposase
MIQHRGVSACRHLALALINLVETNRRDAISLARLLRAGELTAVWVPDPGHEAMRNLIRSRAAAVNSRAQAAGERVFAPS